VNVLTEDIDYIDKETKMLSDDPHPQDAPKYHIAFFPFYKEIDKSQKIDANLRKEHLGEPHLESI